jgi:hypothetical protein
MKKRHHLVQVTKDAPQGISVPAQVDLLLSNSLPWSLLDSDAIEPMVGRVSQNGR